MARHKDEMLFREKWGMSRSSMGGFSLEEERESESLHEKRRSESSKELGINRKRMRKEQEKRQKEQAAFNFEYIMGKERGDSSFWSDLLPSMKSAQEVEAGLKYKQFLKMKTDPLLHKLVNLHLSLFFSLF